MERARTALYFVPLHESRATGYGALRHADERFSSERASAVRNLLPDPTPRIACSGRRLRRSGRRLQVLTRPRIRMPATLRCLPSTLRERSGLILYKMAARLSQLAGGLR